MELQKLQGRVELFFYWDAFSIKKMIWKKTISANFGGAWWAAVPRMQTPGTGAAMSWTLRLDPRT
jgi:hypothetical protein